jgi:hypothetical protein
MEIHPNTHKDHKNQQPKWSDGKKKKGRKPLSPPKII